MPARFRVRITLAAERDVDGIWAFIARDNVEAASRFIRRLERQIDTLERFPERCPLIPENEILGSRYRHLLMLTIEQFFGSPGIQFISCVSSVRVLTGLKVIIG